MASADVFSTVDAALLHLERPHAPLNVGALLTLEAPVEVPDVTRRLHARMRGLRRLGQRPSRGRLGLGGPRWSTPASFRLGDHLMRWGVPAPGGTAELESIVAQLMAQALPLDRPPWQLHLIEGLAEGRGALLLKGHACLVSGLSGVRMLQVLIDGDRDRLAADPPPRASRARAAALARDALRRARQGAARRSRARPDPTPRQRLDALLESLRKLRSGEVPTLPWNAPVGPRRAICLIDVDAAASGRLLERARPTELALAGLAGGMQAWLGGRGAASPVLEAMALLPLTLDATEPGPAGRRSSAMRVRVPLRAADAEARLSATRAVLDRMGSEAAWRGVSGLLQMIDWLPAPLLSVLLAGLTTGRVANAIASALSGPRDRRRLCGREIESIHPLLPIVDGVGLSLAACSYAGRVHAALVTDPALLADPGKLAGGVAQTLSDLGRAG